LKRTTQGLIWQRWWFTPLVLAILTLLFFAPSVFNKNNALAGSDFEQIHYPLLKFVVDSVHDGIIPLWNPHQFLGYSVVGNPQYGLFYPPNWLLLLFGSSNIYLGVAVLIALHTFWASLGMAYLAQSWGANHLSALLAGIIVGFGGFPASKIYAGHYAVLLTLAWMPWILFTYRLAVQKRTLAWIIPSAVTLGLATLAGHPQFIYISVLGLGIIWLYEVVVAENRILCLLITRQLMLIIVIGTLLSAVVWLPALDYQSETGRGREADSSDFANQHAIPPKQLATLLVPDLFGSPLDESSGYWGEPFYEEMTAYVGLLPLILLPLASFLPRREKWLFIGLAVFGIIFSLGFDALLYRIFYELLPPVRDFRAPGRALSLTSIGLATLMALTLTDLQEMSADDRRHKLQLTLRRVIFPLLIILMGGALVLSTMGSDLQDNPDHADYITKQLVVSGVILLIIGLGLGLWASKRWSAAKYMTISIPLILIVITTADVWRLSWPLKNTDKIELSSIWAEASEVIPIEDDSHYGRVMQMYAPPGIINGASWTGHLSPQGYDPIFPDDWFRLVLETGQFIEDPGSAVNRLFGVRYVLSGQPLDNYGFFSSQFFEKISDDTQTYYIYKNDLALPRAYLVENYSVEDNLAIARQRITREDEINQGKLVILPDDPDCSLSERGGTATITDYQPNRVKITVEADGDGLLVLTDQYDKDWKVTVDGEAAQLLQANTTTRAVCIPTGNHAVEFVYQPLSFVVGSIVSGTSTVLLVIIGGYWLRRQRP
jgi:hypothetical protein